MVVYSYHICSKYKTRLKVVSDKYELAFYDKTFTYTLKKTFASFYCVTLKLSLFLFDTLFETFFFF